MQRGTQMTSLINMGKMDENETTQLQAITYRPAGGTMIKLRGRVALLASSLRAHEVYRLQLRQDGRRRVNR